jgi:uncharacterized protein
VRGRSHGLPVAPADRLLPLDALRGVAVLGILLMNIVGLGLPHAAYADPSIIGNRTPLDFWVWAANAVVSDGKFRAILSMLFGASVVLMADRAARAGAGDAAAVHLRRHLWLAVIGVVHAYLLFWPGEILFTYAIAGLPLFAFRNLSPRMLILLGTLVLALQAPRTALQNAELADASHTLRRLDAEMRTPGASTPAQNDARKAALETLSGDKPSPAQIQASIADHRGGYLRNVASAFGTNLYLESTYLFTTGFWDAVGPMLIGMALVKREVFTAARSNRFYLTVAAVGYGVGLPLNIWVVADWTRHGFEAGARWVVFDEITRMSIALGHVAAVMLLCRARAALALMGPLAATGRMALTNYVMQTVAAVAIFSGVGLGWFGALARHQLYFVVAAIWVTQLIVSPLWLRAFRFGPLEWVWRSLTYWRRQPFRLKDAAARSVLL